MITVFENTKKVSFNIVSEANYVYILKPETVLPDRSNWWIIPKLNWDILSNFQTMCYVVEEF